MLTVMQPLQNVNVRDTVPLIAPRYLKLTAKWYVRGGIFTHVVVEHRATGWTPAPRVELDHFAPVSAIQA